MSKILSINNLCFKVKETDLFKTKEKTILNNISFEVNEGEIIGIAGESGSGKTTLAKLIAGVIKPTAGSINFNLTNNSNSVQILFQNTGQILNPFRKIEDIIEEAIKLRKDLPGNIESEKERIFSSVNFQKKYWENIGSNLSGGQQQRAALARLLAVQPELLILDEPFSAQDFESKITLVELSKNINKKFNVTLICISHDLNALRNLCERVIIIYKGKIVEIGKTNEILENPTHPYTKYLIKAEKYDLNHSELMERID
ncbi:MAG: dipeptide/oligopeptide/nickel ABC transporter ATP-binding protein [Ignavibacteriales bacterium CG_4_9_14_3_um_filter_30_11]|nr:MAG: dipeptide/oligopeptide/nickel ABC transporter ATP-binding protein [Ignavibacteriales bacterium CG_4_9_14_3_um_filter_30_11]